MPRDTDIEAKDLAKQRVEDAPQTPLQQYAAQSNPYESYVRQQGWTPPANSDTGWTPPPAPSPEPRKAVSFSRGVGPEEQAAIDEYRANEEAQRIPTLPMSGGGWASTISPGARAEYEGAFEQQRDTSGAGYQQQIEAERRADAIRARAAQDAKDQLDHQIGQAEGQFFTLQNEAKKAEQIKQESDRDVDRALKDVRETKMDPNRFLHEKDTFTNIGIALSRAMGAFWSTVAGGPNVAEEIIQKEMDRDIHSQEVDLSNKRSTADTALRRNFQITGDLEKAKALTRMQMLEIVKHQSQKMALEQGSAVAQGQHEKLMAALAAQGNQAQADLVMRHAEVRSRTEHYVAPAVLGGDLLKQAEKDEKLYVPGLGLATTDKDADILKKEVSERGEFKRGLEELASLRLKIGNQMLTGAKITDLRKTPDYQRFEALANELRFKKSTVTGQGVVRDYERPDFDKMIGNPLSSLIGAQQGHDVISSLADRQGQEIQELGKQYNVQPARMQEVRDPRTNRIQRVYVPQRQTSPDPAFTKTVPREKVQ